MPSIRVEMFEGRTVEQKRALAKELTEATAPTLFAFEYPLYQGPPEAPPVNVDARRHVIFPELESVLTDPNE